MYPLLSRIFRTGFQKHNFKLSPKGLKYLRLIIPIELKGQPVPKTNHSKFSYTPSPLSPVGLDYLGKYIEPHSQAVGRVYRSQKEMKMQWHVLHKKSQRQCHTSCLLPSGHEVKGTQHGSAGQSCREQLLSLIKSSIQGLHFPVQLLRKAILTRGTKKHSLPSCVEQTGLQHGKASPSSRLTKPPPPFSDLLLCTTLAN